MLSRECMKLKIFVTFNEQLNWTRHVNPVVDNTYSKLKHAFRFNKFLNELSKLNLIETYILFQFNYGDVILLDIMAKMLDCSLKVNELLQLFYYIHFLTNTFEEGIKVPCVHSHFVLNSIAEVLHW